MEKHKSSTVAWCGMMLGLVAVAGEAKAATRQPDVIAWNQIGAVAGADYRGDGLSVMPTPAGARVHCVFQRLDGEATPEGMWLSSTVTNSTSDRFRVTAMAIGRKPANDLLDPQAPESSRKLCAQGVIAVQGQTVRLSRPALMEEYSVSMDGVRQDFIVEQAPAGRSLGELVVELGVNGATVEAAPYGARLVLRPSGRRIAYSRLRVTDARGRKLPARMEVSAAGEQWEQLALTPGLPPDSPEGGRTEQSPLALDASSVRLAVVVDDTDADYPVRIDPTFSDDNWVSMGLPLGASQVYAALTDAAGNLYIGGTAGNSRAGVSKWNGSSWSALGTGLNGVYALAMAGNDLYAGGVFTQVEGKTVNYVAHWNGSNWLPMGSGMDNYVYALAVSGGTVYAGGNFSTADGIQVNGIAQWNGTSWSPLGGGMGGTLPYVHALAVSGTNLYAGGFFTMAGGEVTNANYIARWDGTHWWGLDSGMNNRVLVLAVSGSTLYAGGNFTSAGDVTNANYVAQWDGAKWSSLGSGMNGSVYALAVSGDTLFAGGAFKQAGGTNVHSITQWNGTNWVALGPGFDNQVTALAVSGQTLYAMGSFHFTSDSVVALNNIAQWNGTNWSAIGSGLNAGIEAMVISGSTLYAGGDFITAGDLTNVNHVAQWDGTHWSRLGAGLGGRVLALALSGGKLFAGGPFTKAEGSNAFYVAQWDGVHWGPVGPGLSGEVRALAASDGILYAGGDFKNPRGNASVHLNSIAQWDGNTWSPLGTGMGGTSPSVYALAVSGNTVYAGGGFTNAGGTAVNYIAQWDGTNWLPLGLGVGSRVVADVPAVYALAVSSGILYAGGAFTLAGGSNANYVAQWDGINWSPLGSGLAGSSTLVSALAASGNTLYVGGFFTTAGGTPANYIAQWDGNNWSGFGSGMDGAVNALAVGGNTLYAAGDFLFAGGKVSAFVARGVLGASGPVISQDAALGFTNGVFGFNVSGAAGSNIVIDYSTDLKNWTPLQTNQLGSGPFYFSDSQSSANQQRFYGVGLLP